MIAEIRYLFIGPTIRKSALRESELETEVAVGRQNKHDWFYVGNSADGERVYIESLLIMPHSVRIVEDYE